MRLAYALAETGHPNCRQPDKVIDARHQCAESCLGIGYYLYLDCNRLALSGDRDGSVLPPHRWLEHGYIHVQKAGHGRIADGYLAQEAGQGTHPPLGSRQPVLQ